MFSIMIRFQKDILQAEEQKIALDKEFNNWKGNHDQIDDVCVMGVRI